MAKKLSDSQARTSLRIGMIGHKRIPSREGGVEIVVEELSTRLVRDGNIVDVYNRKGHHVSGKEYDKCLISNMREYKGVRIINVPQIDKKGLGALTSSILGTIRALFCHYQIIHYHAEGPCAMIWLPHLLGIHTVATIHGLDWKRAKWSGLAVKYLKFGERITARYADEVIVLSKNMQNYFIEEYNRDTVYIPNGISVPIIKEEIEIKEKWGLEKDSYILFLGRIVPEKGIQYLIDAYKNTDTDKKLVIAGGTSDTDKFMKELKEKAEGDRRIIFTGFVEGESLEELYSNAYLYVLPSDLEGMPLSLLEAMSYGNCCLVSDIPECTEVVEDKAVLFQKANIIDLTEKLNNLLSHPDIVDNYKRQASKFICSKYNWDLVEQATLDLYRKLLQKDEIRK